MGFISRIVPIILLCVLLTIVGPLMAQIHHHEQKFDAQKRTEWLTQNIKKLENSSVQDTNRMVTMNEYEMENGLISFRVRIIKEAWIDFANGDRIHFICNSSHEDEAVGDVCIAFNQDGKIFVNEGHVCGGMINFVFEGTNSPASAALFFSNFTSDTDNKPWKSYR